MRFDREKFFDAYRKSFPSLNQTQVEGLERLLWGVETYHGWWDNIDQISNAFAQIKSETAHSFHPCVEAFYLGDPKLPNYYTGNTDRVHRVQQGFRYYPHFGRGDIQLTWLENYRNFTALVRKYFPELVAEFEHRIGKTFDLVANPDQALDGKVSFAIMTAGMHLGKFRTGHSLDRYIDANEVDHFNARDIVNGDKNYRNKQGEKIGNVIAADAKRFAQILRTSLIEATENDIVEDSAAVPAADIPESVTEIGEADSGDAMASSAAKPPTSPEDKETGRQGEGETFVAEKFPAFIPQIDTAKTWIKRVTAGTFAGSVLAYVGNLPQWLQIGLFAVLVAIVVGAVVVFVKYHDRVFEYVKAMNTLRATDGVHDPIISADVPK